MRKNLALIAVYIVSTWGILWASGMFEPHRTEKVAMRDLMRDYYAYAYEQVEVPAGMVFRVTRSRSLSWFKPGMTVERHDTIHIPYYTTVADVDNAVWAINANIGFNDGGRVKSLRDAGWEGAAKDAERYVGLKPVMAADFAGFYYQSRFREMPSFEGFRMWLNAQ